MNLNTAGALVACMLFTSGAVSAPFYVKPPALSDKITNHRAIVHAMVPDARVHEVPLDLPEDAQDAQMEALVAFSSSELGPVSMQTETAKKPLDRVFKTVTVPAPEKIVQQDKPEDPRGPGP